MDVVLLDDHHGCSSAGSSCITMDVVLLDDHHGCSSAGSSPWM